MSFLLDTNILSAHLRRPAGLVHRFVQHSGGAQVEGTPTSASRCAAEFPSPDMISRPVGRWLEATATKASSGELRELRL